MLIDLSHAKRTFIGLDGAGDITFAQSMMVQKLSLFAWNVYDGRRRTEASLRRRARRARRSSSKQFADSGDRTLTRHSSPLDSSTFPAPCPSSATGEYTYDPHEWTADGPASSSPLSLPDRVSTTRHTTPSFSALSTISHHRAYRPLKPKPTSAVCPTGGSAWHTSTCSLVWASWAPTPCMGQRQTITGYSSRPGGLGEKLRDSGSLILRVSSLGQSTTARGA